MHRQQRPANSRPPSQAHARHNASQGRLSGKRLAGPEHLVNRNPAKERTAMQGAPANPTGFALQVSAFSQPGPATVMAEELQKSGHKARIRQVGTATGSSTYSVEVGQFADARKATHFQRNFERSSGYPTILVPVR